MGFLTKTQENLNPGTKAAIQGYRQLERGYTTRYAVARTED